MVKVSSHEQLKRFTTIVENLERELTEAGFVNDDPDADGPGFILAVKGVGEHTKLGTIKNIDVIDGFILLTALEETLVEDIPPKLHKALKSARDKTISKEIENSMEDYDPDYEAEFITNNYEDTEN